MSTTNTENPFTAGVPPSRGTMERYARGSLSSAEQHALEIIAQNDPLVADAMEGIAMPGAIDALRDLAASPRRGMSRAWIRGGMAGAILITGVALSFFIGASERPKRNTPVAHVRGSSPVHPAEVVKRTDSLLRKVHREIERTTPQEIPAPRPTTEPERFLLRDSASVAHMDHIPPRVAHVGPEPSAPGPGHAVMHHLVFRHGLKLVHPDELYPAAEPLLFSMATPASQESASAGDPMNLTDRLAARPSGVDYLDYMGSVLKEFEAGNSEGALDDLFFLLQQYPDDVNAQFYVGQCCYNLGLMARARDWFGTVQRNKVDAFNEEADWYETLASERLEGRGSVRPRLERIAHEGGFYSAQAKERLK